MSYIYITYITEQGSTHKGLEGSLGEACCNYTKLQTKLFMNQQLDPAVPLPIEKSPGLL